MLYISFQRESVYAYRIKLIFIPSAVSALGEYTLSQLLQCFSFSLCQSSIDDDDHVHTLTRLLSPSCYAVVSLTAKSDSKLTDDKQALGSLSSRAGRHIKSSQRSGYSFAQLIATLLRSPVYCCNSPSPSLPVDNDHTTTPETE